MSSPSVSVIGSGGWGTALAILMARRGLNVPLWGHDPLHVEAMAAGRINGKYLPGVELPASIMPTNALADCVQSDVLFVAVPSKHLAPISAELAEAASGRLPTLVSCTKGIELSRGLLMSEVIAEQFPSAPITVLSGPNLAGEIARGMPAAGVIGGTDPGARNRVQALFEGTSFRAYTGSDVRGIQLGGALKNIFAIGAGVSDGLGLGENARAALVTRSLAEMTRLGVAMGGLRETFSGLSGVGDLTVTCLSSSSRNHQVGVRLGGGERVESIVGSMAMAAEGIPTTAGAYHAARRQNVETPIIDAIHALLEGEKTAAQGLRDLMARQLRSEEDF